MNSLESRHSSIKQVVWLVLFVYALIAIFLLFLPPKANAGETDEQVMLLDGLLGRLAYTESGFFIPVDDVVMELDLANIQSQLDNEAGSAWILDRQTGFAVWGSARVRVKPPLMGDVDTPALQIVSDADYRYVIQNFWLTRDGGTRADFQMVVALPVN